MRQLKRIAQNSKVLAMVLCSRGRSRRLGRLLVLLLSLTHTSRQNGLGLLVRYLLVTLNIVSSSPSRRGRQANRTLAVHCNSEEDLSSDCVACRVDKHLKWSHQAMVGTFLNTHASTFLILKRTEVEGESTRLLLDLRKDLTRSSHLQQVGRVGLAVDRSMSVIRLALALGTRCHNDINTCLLYTSPSPRDKRQSRMPSSA